MVLLPTSLASLFLLPLLPFLCYLASVALPLLPCLPKGSKSCKSKGCSFLLKKKEGARQRKPGDKRKKNNSRLKKRETYFNFFRFSIPKFLYLEYHKWFLQPYTNSQYQLVMFVRVLYLFVPILFSRFLLRLNDPKFES